MATSAEIVKIKKTPATFVIFGATGDLSRKKIFPSFYQLHKANLLPEKFKIIACARTKHTTDDFISILAEYVDVEDAKTWETFTHLIEYFPSDIASGENLDALGKMLDEFEQQINECPQRVFYMAISHEIYKSAFDNLGKTKLSLGCQKHNCRARVVVEKPFGSNYQTAQELNAALSQYFAEDQIFRIDHFLGKETVQNIFTFRFGNEIFEPVWNNKYIDHVQITAAEYIGIEKRGAFYDKTGALRDFVQNHLLQLLSLVTMEEPRSFEQSAIRDRKLEILNSLKKMTPEEVAQNTVRGQYEGYLNEENIAANSQTETYALTKLFIENERWQGVPFYLRTGKKLMGKVTSIIFAFKEREHHLLAPYWNQPMPNHVTIQIDPSEGIGIRLAAKKPGLTQEVEPVDMEFCYKTSFDTPNPSAYERLLLDIIAGDQTLFLGPIGPSWKFIDSIREVWDSGTPTLAKYKHGSWGPEEADKLIEKDGRKWLAPLLTICKI